MSPYLCKQHAKLSNLLSCSHTLSASPSVDNCKSFSNLVSSSYFLTSVSASSWVSVPNNTFQDQQRLKSLELPGPVRWSACSHIFPNTQSLQLSLPFPPRTSSLCLCILDQMVQCLTYTPLLVACLFLSEDFYFHNPLSAKTPHSTHSVLTGEYIFK